MDIFIERDEMFQDKKLKVNAQKVSCDREDLSLFAMNARMNFNAITPPIVSEIVLFDLMRFSMSESKFE
jgi:hypothetical protein